MLFFKIFELLVNWCYVYVLMLYVIYFDAVETETEKYIYLGQNTFIFWFLRISLRCVALFGCSTLILIKVSSFSTKLEMQLPCIVFFDFNDIHIGHILHSKFDGRATAFFKY